MARAVIPFQTEDHTLQSCDGESSVFLRHYSRGKPRLHFLLVHGAIEHSGRHTELISYLLRNYNEVAVTVYDNVGHGKSGGPRSYVPSFKVFIDDMLKVGEFVQSKNNERTKNFILSHSLGGLITLTRLLDTAYGWPFPVQGIIFSSPCIKPHMALGNYSEPILHRLDKLLPKLHLPMIYKGIDLTRDPERANAFDTDNLIPKYITVRFAREIIDTSHKVRGLSYYFRVPSLFLIAGDDKIVDAESTFLFAHGIDKRLTEVIQYPEHRHELWNELDRQDIFDTMKKWIERQLKENP